MRFDYFALLISVVFTGVSSSQASKNSEATCLPLSEAGKYVGTNQCVRGTVVRTEDGENGARLLNFCQDSKACPFRVYVFASDVKKLGDIRQLEGKQIEIKGTIQDFNGHAEIVLRRSKQLGEASFLLFPTVPTEYDVERQGRSKAGSAKLPKKAKTTTKKQTEPAPVEDPGEPQ